MASCLMMGPRTLAGALVPLVSSMPEPENVGPFVDGDYDRINGLQGDGSNKYLRVQRNLNDDAKDDCSYGFYKTNTGDVAGGQIVFGGSRFNISGTSFICRATGGSEPFGAGCQSSTRLTSGAVSLTNPGYYSVSRRVSTQFRYMIAGVQQTDFTSASQSPSAAEQRFFAGTDAGSESNARLSFYHSGGSVDEAKLRDRLATYITALTTALT
jgi:hypothetical protein